MTIISEDNYIADKGPCISIGRTELSKKILSDEELNKLGLEGYIIDSRDENLFIVGGDQRGGRYLAEKPVRH